MAKRTTSALGQALTKNSRKVQIKVHLADPNSTEVEDLEKMQEEINGEIVRGESPLVKSILNVLNGGGGKTIERLAFEQDPTLNNEYSSLYYTKVRLIPDTMLKRIAIQDDLVAAIVNTRSAQLAAFGRPRPDRHSNGFIIEPNAGILDGATDEQKKDIEKRIDKVEKQLLTCGETKGWKDRDKLTFAQFLGMTVRDSIIVGRFSVEVIYVLGTDGKRKFHSFRPIDAGTIYRAAPQKNAAEQVRKQARLLLEQLKNKKLQPEKFENDEYAWVQVIEGKPVQAFTAEECLVHNMYPVTDVMLAGYPLTPIDTMISAVTTHINITTHNKLYFQSGRASRGMLVIKSDDVKESDVASIRQHFNASINNVNNAWRMPVFGLGSEDEIEWVPIDGQSRDMEFQYLSDSNARVILSAFQMSPEELPGYAHLSRGTNNQALSESNNEYKLEAARDVGIRPLIMQFQDFINASVFPLLDENLAKICTIKLVGLDSDTAEKESTRIQQDMPVHLTQNDIMDIVEKDPVPKELCGDILLNPQWLQHLDKYVTVGTIMEKLMGIQGASKDPQFAYVRDPFWFQWQELQMQAQQGAGGGGGGGGGGDPGGGGGEGGGGGGNGPTNDDGVQRKDSPEPKDGGAQSAPGGSGDMQQPVSQTEQNLDSAMGALGKSEAQLPPSKRRLVQQQAKLVTHWLSQLEEDARKSIDEVLEIAEKHAPKHKKD
jgi:uncharacterized membrane protein YgcG